MNVDRGSRPPPPEGPADRPSLRGVEAVRRALGLGESEREAILRVGKALQPYADELVDAFYARLLTDPVAMRIVSDDARVIRLKRSLGSWFHQFFTQPWDLEYERSREGIGEAHVRLSMPTYLMITAMSGLRRDLMAKVLDLFDADPDEARALAEIVSRALDLELTMILMAFRRRERAEAREKDRIVYAHRAARRFAHTLYDRVDAALCYTELAESDDGRRSEWLAKLRGVLRGLSRFDQRLQVQARVNGVAPEIVAVGDLCRQALADVSIDATTSLELDVEPETFTARIVAPAVHRAVEELAQNAARHAAGGTIRVEVRPRGDEGVVIEVTDEGPGWDADVREFRDMYSRGTGLGLSFCEVVAELHEGAIDLFRAPSGGAGVRLTLGGGDAEAEAEA